MPPTPAGATTPALRTITTPTARSPSPKAMTTPEGVNNTVCPQTLAFGTLKAMRKPTYRTWANLSACLRHSPQLLAVRVLEERWTDAFCHMSAEKRRRIAKSILMEAAFTLTRRVN